MKIGLLDIIYFRLRKKQMLALAKMPHNELEPQSRFNDERFEFCFYDKDGWAYYKVKEGIEIPIVRMLHACTIAVKLWTGISDQDFTISLNAIEKAINELNDKGKPAPNILRIGSICKILQSRKGVVVNQEVIHELAACYFIREDEAIEFINEDIQKQKVKTLAVEGERSLALFYSRGMSELFPYLKDTDATMSAIMKVSNIELAAYLDELTQYLDGDRRSNS